MLKYYNRTHLKIAGLSNFYFSGDRENNKVFLSADYITDIGKGKYKISLNVEADKERTSSRNINNLVKLMIEKLEDFKSLKVTDQKKMAELIGERYEI